MKAIPIDYIKELIEVLQDCKQDEEEKRGGGCLRICYIATQE